MTFEEALQLKKSQQKIKKIEKNIEYELFICPADEQELLYFIKNLPVLLYYWSDEKAKSFSIIGNYKLYWFSTDNSSGNKLFQEFKFNN